MFFFSLARGNLVAYLVKVPKDKSFSFLVSLHLMNKTFILQLLPRENTCDSSEIDHHTKEQPEVKHSNG